MLTILVPPRSMYKGNKGRIYLSSLISLFPLEARPSSGFYPGLCHELAVWHQSNHFPSLGLNVPFWKQGFGGHSEGPYLISCTFNSSLLSISLPSVLHNKLGAHFGTQEGHSQCFGEKDVYNNCYSFLGTCWVSDPCWGLPYLILGTQPRKCMF